MVINILNIPIILVMFYDDGQLYVTLEIAVLLACLILNEGRSRQDIRVRTSYWQELLSPQVYTTCSPFDLIRLYL